MKNKKMDLPEEQNPKEKVASAKDVSMSDFEDSLRDKIRGYIVAGKQIKDSFTKKMRGGKTILLPGSF